MSVCSSRLAQGHRREQPAAAVVAPRADRLTARALKAALIALIATVAVLTGPADPAAAAPPGEFLGTTEIRNGGLDNMCLDAFAGEGGGNGNHVGLWRCNGGPTELWSLYRIPGGGAYDIAIYSPVTGRSLDYPASSNGAAGWQYELWDYRGWPGYSDGQRFAISCGLSHSECEVRVAIAGNYLMDAFASDGGGNGNRVGTWPYTGSRLQQWSFFSLDAVFSRR
jgi:hypothetical protein